MFLYLTILAPILAPLFPNHAAALIFTPILLPILTPLHFNQKILFPFIIPTPFIPHTTSLPLLLT
ncbi:ArsB/NhaD family transporter, partial [Bacillus altitudinis]|uniref:ArsB/NhaD family transporter n=1 Tax=Bacillus altitudinis TaxID=293387 RepID=UPI003B529564